MESWIKEDWDDISFIFNKVYSDRDYNDRNNNCLEVNILGIFKLLWNIIIVFIKNNYLKKLKIFKSL